MVAVNLAPLGPVNHERREKTYTDNISLRGARVRSTYTWKPGDLAEITPVSGEPPARGEVVYCQKLDINRFFVGLKVRENRIPWSILRRFDGVDVANFDDMGIRRCKSCGSDKQEKFMAQIAIHLPDVDKPHVCASPELLVCQHCGKAEFTIPEDRLRLLMK